ncbi:cystatin-like protein [Colossoma macropomum]|uniref:cystatin-like protein n=1 Tax=Colossoma macropomum TaxID=42526 RepID=UPI00186450E2|nr:cystatin-like protein [Colossoma macropomum]
MNKMSAVLKLLLLTAMTLLVSAQEWDNYESLPESYRTHIDKALREANERFGGPHHVAYEKLLLPLKITDNNLYVNVRLIVTTCKKEPHKGFGHRDDCITQKPKTPWIDCLVCKQENGEELIDCARQVDVRNGRDIRKECAYWTHGGATVLSQKSGNNKQELGCLGCV